MPKLGANYADHPMVRWVRSLDEPYMMRFEVAQTLDITLSHLSYLAKNFPGEELGPTHRAAYQDVEILLYTADRVEHMRDFLASHADSGRGRGRSRMFTAAELQERRRKGNRVRDYRKRAAIAMEAGKKEQAASMLVRADAIDKDLREGKAKRTAELQASVKG
jgi:hypothetical protein